MLGDPALRLLMRLKLRGVVRKQVRKLKTPKGIVLSLLGALVFGAWLLSLVGGTFAGRARGAHPSELAYMIRFGGVFLTLLTCVGSLNHRGLFLPGEEIERLFSAPVRRTDLARYRLLTNLFRSLVATLFVSALLMGRAPRPFFCFAATVVGMAFLPVLGQATSILAGGLEKRFDRWLALPKLLMFLVAIVGIAWVPLTFTVGQGNPDPRVWFDDMLAGPVEEWLVHPVLLGVTLPFEPLARAATAETWSVFAPWLLACMAVWVAAFELTSRLPIDFRELSLETSANVAERIRRVRRGGGGASAAKLSKRVAGFRIPWYLGRGPMGALAWRKTCGIVRKARGTLFVTLGVMTLLTFVGASIARDFPDSQGMPGTLFIAGLGTLYMCSGLRFDFRDDLMRMDDIKAWPLPPSRLFLAMLLPEVLLVSGLLVLGILLLAAFLGVFHPANLAVMAALPLVVLAWVALDNAVFLFSPVRFVPGQDGSLQNAGRAMVMMMARMGLLCVVVALTALVAVPVFLLLRNVMHVGLTWTIAATTAAGWVVLFCIDVGLVLLGGWLFRRFDVSSAI